METVILQVGTTMGGGLGAIMCAEGIWTTLRREVGIMVGIGDITCPDARRTTGDIGGLGMTGIADRRVVRTCGICLQ